MAFVYPLIAKFSIRSRFWYFLENCASEEPWIEKNVELSFGADLTMLRRTPKKRQREREKPSYYLLEISYNAF